MLITESGIVHGCCTCNIHGRVDCGPFMAPDSEKVLISHWVIVLCVLGDCAFHVCLRYIFKTALPSSSRFICSVATNRKRRRREKMRMRRRGMRMRRSWFKTRRMTRCRDWSDAPRCTNVNSSVEQPRMKQPRSIPHHHHHHHPSQAHSRISRCTGAKVKITAVWEDGDKPRLSHRDHSAALQRISVAADGQSQTARTELIPREERQLLPGKTNNNNRTAPIPAPTRSEDHDGLQTEQTEQPGQWEFLQKATQASGWRRGGERAGRRTGRRGLSVRADAEIGQAARDAAEVQPQSVHEAGGVDQGDSEAAPRAQDRAGDRRAQTTEEGKRRGDVRTARPAGAPSTTCLHRAAAALVLMLLPSILINISPKQQAEDAPIRVFTDIFVRTIVSPSWPVLTCWPTSNESAFRFRFESGYALRFGISLWWLVKG